MANVARELERIENATYGEEVRSSIHDAIDAMNQQAIEAYETAVDSQESCLNSKNIVLETKAQIDADRAEAAANLQAVLDAKDRAVLAQNESEIARDIAIASKDAAGASEIAAKESEEAAINANNSIQVAKADAIAAKNRAEECYNDLISLYGSIGNGFIIKGPATLATLPSNPEPGWLYVMTESFTTNSLFVEGEGIEKPAGTKVYYTDSGKWAIAPGDDAYVITENVKNTLTYNGFTEILKTSGGEVLATSDNEYVLSLKALTPEFRHYLIGSYITLSLLLGNSIETIFHTLQEMGEV